MKKKPLSQIAPIIVYCFFIFYLSSRPVPENFSGGGAFFIEGFDKIYHLILYLPLGFFCARLFSDFETKIIFATLFCLLYGISDEVHQIFVLERDFEFLDVGCNLAGGFLGALMYVFWQFEKKKLKNGHCNLRGDP